MGRPARRIEVTATEDDLLREIELSPHTHPKARLRASLLRLHRRGWTVPQLAEHFDRNHQAVHNDLTRYVERGIAGLADNCSSGPPPVVTADMAQFLHEKLQEAQFWNAPLLCEALEKQFGIVLQPRTLQNHLRRLGYSWKRARYSPAKSLDPEVIQQHQASLDTLKKGHWTAS